MQRDDIDILRSDDEPSSLDSEYPLYRFMESVAPDAERVQEAVNAFYSAAAKNASIISQMTSATDQGVRYVVDTPDAMLDALEQGRIKFTQEKGGRTFAQLRDNSGRYGEKVPIKREEFAKGVDPTQMAMAIQLQSIQGQLQEVREEVAEIGRIIRSVLQGQHDDRKALFLSGFSLYLEAREIKDESFRLNILAQAQRSLSDAANQVTLELQASIDSIKKARNDKFRGIKDKRKFLEESINSIYDSFNTVHQATLLRAAIYGELDEFSATAKVLEEYARFLNDNISANAGLLAECDSRDQGFDHGIWKTRSRLSSEIKSITAALHSRETVFYLSDCPEDNHGKE